MDYLPFTDPSRDHFLHNNQCCYLCLLEFLLPDRGKPRNHTYLPHKLHAFSLSLIKHTHFRDVQTLALQRRWYFPVPTCIKLSRPHQTPTSGLGIIITPDRNLPALVLRVLSSADREQRTQKKARKSPISNGVCGGKKSATAVPRFVSINTN